MTGITPCDRSAGSLGPGSPRPGCAAGSGRAPAALGALALALATLVVSPGDVWPADPNELACDDVSPFAEERWARGISDPKRQQDDARTEALERATAALLDQLCPPGTPEALRREVRRHISPAPPQPQWIQAEGPDAARRRVDHATVKGGRWTACRVVGAPSRFQSGEGGWVASAAAALRGVAEKVSAALGPGDPPLRVAAPLWADGQAAPGAGWLADAFRTSFPADAGQWWDKDDERAAVVTFRVSLVGYTDEALATLELDVEGRKSAIGTPLRLPVELVGDHGSHASDGNGDDALGVPDGTRPGAGGLRVTVRRRGADGPQCEGRVLGPSIQVDRPARVQLYALQPDGSARVVFPFGSVSDRVDTRLDFPDFTALAEADPRPERLVAVAVDPSATFGATEGWRDCRVPATMGANWIPREAAVGSTWWEVLPGGVAGCVAPPDRVSLKDDVEDVPACPEPALPIGSAKGRR